VSIALEGIVVHSLILSASRTEYCWLATTCAAAAWQASVREQKRSTWAIRACNLLQATLSHDGVPEVRPGLGNPYVCTLGNPWLVHAGRLLPWVCPPWAVEAPWPQLAGQWGTGGWRHQACPVQGRNSEGLQSPGLHLVLVASLHLGSFQATLSWWRPVEVLVALTADRARKGPAAEAGTRLLNGAAQPVSGA